MLHWTKLNQNWNFMCAECHSTGVRKNYDAATDRFATTWAEISVGCEACHGQGSRACRLGARAAKLVALHKDDDPDKGLLVRFDERAGVTWAHDAKTGIPRASAPPADIAQGGRDLRPLPCAARRVLRRIGCLGGRSPTRTRRRARQGLYQADGQMLDEVYNYGSFKQSRMYAAGVTCSDCHDPHSAKLKRPGDESACNATPDKYASRPIPHRQGSPGARLRRPATCRCAPTWWSTRGTITASASRAPTCRTSSARPTPATTATRTSQRAWAAAAIEGWYGPERKGLAELRARVPRGVARRARRAPMPVAAWPPTPTLPPSPAPARSPGLPAVSSGNSRRGAPGLSDADPMVRIAALDMLDDVPANQLWPVISPLLSDPVRGVRIRAASLLAGVPSERLSATDRATARSANAGVYRRRKRLNADRPEARATLGNFHARRGAGGRGEKPSTRRPCGLSPAYGPAAANLADLYRQLGRDADAESVLRQAIEASPKDAGLHHALGLALVRLKRQDDALPSSPGPPSLSLTARAMPMSMPWRSTRAAAAAMRSRLSRIVSRGTRAIATRSRRSSASTAMPGMCRRAWLRRAACEA